MIVTDYWDGWANVCVLEPPNQIKTTEVFFLVLRLRIHKSKRNETIDNVWTNRNALEMEPKCYGLWSIFVLEYGIEKYIISRYIFGKMFRIVEDAIIHPVFSNFRTTCNLLANNNKFIIWRTFRMKEVTIIHSINIRITCKNLANQQ